MHRQFSHVAVAVLALLVAAACARGDKQPDPPPEAEAVTCGGWVVVVENAVVGSRYDGPRIQGTLLDALRDAGCDAHTARPATIPEGYRVVSVAPRVSTAGEGGRLSIIATDADSGAVEARLQERIAPGADGTEVARQTAGQLADRLQD